MWTMTTALIRSGDDAHVLDHDDIELLRDSVETYIDRWEGLAPQANIIRAKEIREMLW